MAAYVVVMRVKIRDESEMETYRSMVPASAKGRDMKILSRYARLRVLEGDPIEGCVLIKFPTFEEAEAWYDSPEYQAALQHRLRGGEYRAFIVEGE